MFYINLSKHWISVIILNACIIHGFQSLNVIFDPGQKGCGENDFSSKCFDIWHCTCKLLVHVITLHQYIRLSRLSICFPGCKFRSKLLEFIFYEYCRILSHDTMKSLYFCLVNYQGIYVCIYVILSLEKLHFTWPCRVICKQRQQLKMICF